MADGPVAAQRRLGAELRRLRTAAGMSGAELANQLGWSQSKVSRIEAARTLVAVGDVADLLERLSQPAAERAPLIELAKAANGELQGWWSEQTNLPRRARQWAILEGSATSILHYQPQNLPGLVQTWAYAEAVLRLGNRQGEPHIEAALRARMARAAMLSAANGPSMKLVLAEAALRWRPTDELAYREQLQHLLHLCKTRRLAVRVIALGSRALGPAVNSFALYDFAGQDIPAEVVVETLTTDLFINSAAEVALYREMHRRLTSSALGVQASRELIAHLRDA